MGDKWNKLLTVKKEWHKILCGTKVKLVTNRERERERARYNQDRKLRSLLLYWCRCRYTWDLFPEYSRVKPLKKSTISILRYILHYKLYKYELCRICYVHLFYK